MTEAETARAAGSGRGAAPRGGETHLRVALLLSAHGVSGELKARCLSDDPDRLLGLEEVWLTSPEGELLRRVGLSARRAHGCDLVRLEGVDDRDAAERLRGAYLAVERARALPLPEGRYYECDLLGLAVEDAVRGPIGRLRRISYNGAQDVYEIARPGRKPLYLAVTDETFLGAEPGEGIIRVRLPEGLWEVYE